MGFDRYRQMILDSKTAMDLTDALKIVRYLVRNECVSGKKWKKHGYCMSTKMKYIRTACLEFEKELTNASPWEDYRDILAKLSWPYMKRVISHSYENRYSGEYGEKWREADAWFVEMWTAYHVLLMRMPGFSQCKSWNIYEVALGNARQNTSKYRRNL